MNQEVLISILGGGALVAIINGYIALKSKRMDATITVDRKYLEDLKEHIVRLENTIDKYENNIKELTTKLEKYEARLFNDKGDRT